MHWFKTTGNSGRTEYLNLAGVRNVYTYPDGSVRLVYDNEHWNDLSDGAAVLARLDALAEIATHRTVAHLSLTEETE